MLSGPIGARGPAVVYAAGEFDMYGLSLFKRVLHEALEHGRGCLIIDLTGVTFIGSSGLAGLVLGQRQFSEVMLRGVAPNVMRVIDVGGLGGVFTTID